MDDGQYCVPYTPRHRTRRPRHTDIILAAVSVMACLAGVIIGASQREPRQVALVCHYPAPTIPTSSRPPVALLCEGETR